MIRLLISLGTLLACENLERIIGSLSNLICRWSYVAPWLIYCMFGVTSSNMCIITWLVILAFLAIMMSFFFKFKFCTFFSSYPVVKHKSRFHHTQSIYFLTIHLLTLIWDRWDRFVRFTFLICLLISPWLQATLYLIPHHILKRHVQSYTYPNLDSIPNIIGVIGVGKNMTNKPCPSLLSAGVRSIARG